MKLYYMPSACSLSVRITLHEPKLPHRLELVDAKTKTLPDGSDFHAVKPRGQVPVLELDDGSLLTEGPVIVQYLGDTFTSADGYLFTMLRWTGFLGIALERWPDLVAYRDRVAARPAVQAAMRDAGC